MGIEEAILQDVKEQGIEQGIEKGIEQGMTLKTIKGIQKAILRNKLTLEEIAEDFEVSLEYVLKVKNGEIK